MKKICIKCKEEKNIDEFHKNKTTKDGYNFTCKLCTKKYYEEHKEVINTRSKKFRIDNYERMVEYDKNYREKNRAKIANRVNKKRVLQIEESFEEVTDEWIEKLNKISIFCPLCLEEMNSKNDRNILSKELDHIIPINLGGLHTKSNIRFICSRCNKSRPEYADDLIGSFFYKIEHNMKI